MMVEGRLPTERPREIARVAAELEALGLDGIVTNETAHDSLLPLAVAASATERCSLGTSVTIAFPRSPMVLAMAAWDLAALSRGRFNLGLGTQVRGHIEGRFSTPWAAPGPRLREYVEALHAIWACFQHGGRLDFQGKHYRFNLMTPFFNPGPIDWPQVPVYVAAVNPYNCRLAGELCDGLRLHSFCTQRYLDEVILPAVRAGAAAAGRDPAAVAIAASAFIATGETESDVEVEREVARRRIAFYGSTRAYFPVFEIHGWQDTGEQLRRLAAQGQWDQMPGCVSDEQLDAFCTSGTYDEIIPRLLAAWGPRAQRLNFPVRLDTPAARERTAWAVRALQRYSPITAPPAT